MEDYSPKKTSATTTTKKQKQKFITKPTNKKYKKDCKGIIEVFLKMRKLKEKLF